MNTSSTNCISFLQASWWQKGQSVPLIILIYVTGYIIMHFLCTHPNRKKWKWYNHCLITCPKEWRENVSQTRGDDYFLDNLEKTQPIKQPNKTRRCLMTFWGGMHALFYLLLGFVAPKLWPVLVLVGIGFEMAESFWDCADILDIVWNGIGLICGIGLRQLLCPTIS